MSFLKNAKIRTKILSVLIPMAIVAAGSALTISHEFKLSDAEYVDLIENQEVASVAMTRASQRLAALSYNAYQVLAYDAASPEMAGFVEAYELNKKQLFDFMATSKAHAEERAASVDPLVASLQDLVAVTDEAVKAGQADDNPKAKALLRQADVKIKTQILAVRQWIDDELALVRAQSVVLSARTETTIFYTLTTLALVFAAAIVAALVVASRGITQPIAALQARMQALAAGQTDAPVPGTARRDEMGQMAAAVSVFRDNALERRRLENEADANRSLSEKERIEREAQKAREAEETRLAVEGLAEGLAQLSAGNVTHRIDKPFVAHLDRLRQDFNGSMAKLQETLTGVSQNARGIDAGANEIRSAADDLSKRTEQQAASVEETAAALEQITTTVKDSTRRAEEAGQIVSRARGGAERSGEVMRQAVSAMENIAKSSNEISNIIGVIDEIAFQTNLLALNAGVEAARAGEAGKGFAVVAQEVRELAQRSAQAAKEIKALISTSGAQVASGVELVARTGQSLDQIVREVEEIDHNVRAIVEAAREQATGLQEINTAVNAIDQGTQQNAAMVEQSTAASHSLAKEVASLNRLLGQFEIGSGRAVAPGPVAAASRSQPAASPARALHAKIAGAFGARGAAATAAAPAADNWEEF